MGNLEKYNKKIHKLKNSISILKRKKSYYGQKREKIKRIMRARKLLKLGIIFEISYTIIYSKEIIVGYLLELNEKKIYEIGVLRYKGNQILENKSVDKHDEEEILLLNTEERKKRNHKLIGLGALFEITGTDKFSLAVLVSYLDDLHNKNNDNFTKYQSRGENFFIERSNRNV